MSEKQKSGTADVAIERGYEYYFWGHADVAVLAKDESSSFADDVIACVESAFESRPNWGIIYFAYDWFSAIRTDLVRHVSSCICPVLLIVRRVFPPDPQCEASPLAIANT